MKDSLLILILMFAGFCFVMYIIISVSNMIMSDSTRCHSKNGVYVKTYTGFVCIRTEEIKLH
jgi:hypothetical protein